ncbi:uncharacterized protein K460DRAFT_436223 [Cucurbitaria berberidis CBS 394.84]|uniref:Uncharacterized protein n=1 Tax=Cucurbitaria berberidis CBS 394.84 TaxID=1168544 RepID=A0A9P4G8A5_9PLEO|nr:uncharacterized protein K460DRAFT_436223 [Cucurbitaria berberidis CBS 394.84]KAF1840747.1 hypothetical protein K460DRAFT_436223 [Cucurbitaria berberidis CBS 394.84]
MVGIHSTKEFAAQTANQKSHYMPDISHNDLHFDGRAVPNLGMVSYIRLRTSFDIDESTPTRSCQETVNMLK